MTYKTSFKQKIMLIIFGLFSLLIIIEIGLRVAGFVYLSLQDYKNRLSLTHKGQYRILCLGDSMTAFWHEKSYPAQLEQILNQRMPDVRFSVINKGIPGVNSTYIVSQLARNLNKYQPDMVVVMMGINDELFLPEEGTGERVKNFLGGFRVYNLARLLYIHIEYTLGRREYIEGKYINLGRFYNYRRNYLQAENVFKKAIEIFPDSQQAYIDLAWSYNEQEKFNEAREMFKRAIEVNPHSYRVYIELARFLKGHKDYLRAEEMYKKSRGIYYRLYIKPG